MSSKVQGFESTGGPATSRINLGTPVDGIDGDVRVLNDVGILSLDMSLISAAVSLTQTQHRKNE